MDSKQLKNIVNDNRRRIVEMVHAAGVGHIGGSLSVIDILTVIYEVDVDLSSSQRSRVVLSKGHATPALYAELTQKGIINEDEYPSFRQLNSRLQGHPSQVNIPEIDGTTGLLGQGFSIALGEAIAKKATGDLHHVYAIAGDGEMQEGQNWEALMCAAHYGLDNLTFVVDYNRLSSSGDVNESLRLEPLVDKLRAFGLHVIEIDGHNIDQILAALKESNTTKGKPSAIIAHTIKGKGISFMENNPQWHSKGLSDEQYEAALRDIESEKAAIANG